MTAMSVLVSFTACLTESTRWALNESHTNELYFRSRPPGLARQTFCIQIFNPSSIHPFGWMWTTTPGGIFSLGMVFLLKITIGFNFVPSPRQDNMTVNCDFSWPVVLITTVFSPQEFTVFADGMSNHTGGPSIFPIRTSSYCFPLRCLLTNLWNLVILSSKLSGSFWAILVFCRNAKLAKKPCAPAVRCFEDARFQFTCQCFGLDSD